MIPNKLSSVAASTKWICLQQMPIKMQQSWQQHILHPSHKDGNGDCPVTQTSSGPRYKTRKCVAWS